MRLTMNRCSVRSAMRRVTRVGWLSIVSTVTVVPLTVGGPSG
jgi:hypothetical protein